MKLKLVTLKTNHTILAEVWDTYLSKTLKSPVQVVMQATKDGPVVGFVPFLEYSEEFKTGITISENDILCITTPVTELVNQYNQIFGSGIQIASVIPKV